MRFAAWVLAAGLVVCAGSVLAEPAISPESPLTDMHLEARAQMLFEEVRCVVCQHESIADSPSGLASDMRRLIREEITSGATDETIRADLVRRWGDFVLFRPPLAPATLFLWFGPLAGLFFAGALFFIGRTRRADGPASSPLSSQEEERIEQLLSLQRQRPESLRES